MNHRSDTLLPSLAGVPSYGASFQVTAYAIGGQAASSSSGSTITVRAGHGFEAGDKFLLRPGSSNIFTGNDSVQSITSTTIVMSGSYSVASGDLLVNLGPDTGTSAPAYDGSGATVYSDMDGSTAIGNATVLTGQFGGFEYWTDAVEVWELFRDPDGDVAGTGITQWGAVDSVFTRTGAVVAATNDYTWAQIDKSTSDIADITTKSHTSLSDIGSNTHAQVDTHIADATKHFLENDLTKHVGVESPVSSENIFMFFTNKAISIVETVAVIVGGTSVVYNVNFSTERNDGTPSELWSSDKTEGGFTAGTAFTAFDDATIPADSWIWLITGTVTGAVEEFDLHIRYTED